MGYDSAVKRPWFKLLAAASLLLCAVIIFIWHRSCFVAWDRICLHRPPFSFRWLHAMDASFSVGRTEMKLPIGRHRCGAFTTDLELFIIPKRSISLLPTSMNGGVDWPGRWQMHINNSVSSHQLTGIDAGISCGLLVTILLALACLLHIQSFPSQPCWRGFELDIVHAYEQCVTSPAGIRV